MNTSRSTSRISRPAIIAALIVAALFIAVTLWAADPSTEAVRSTTTGLKIGEKRTDRLGFYNATPTAQPISANNAPVNATPLPTAAGTPSTANVTALEGQVNAQTVLLNQIQGNLAAQGLMATATPTATNTPTPTP